MPIYQGDGEGPQAQDPTEPGISADLESLLRTTNTAAQDAPPDRAARILKLRGRMGVDESLLEDNLEEAEKLAAEASFNAEEFRKSHPRLADWYSKSKHHIAIAKPDEASLKRLDRLYFKRDDPARPLSQQEIAEQSKRAAKRRVDRDMRTLGPMLSEPPSEADIKARVEQAEREEIAERAREERYIAGTDKVGFFESVGQRFRQNPAFMVPFVSSAPDIDRIAELYTAAKAIETGTATEDDTDLVIRFGRLAEASERRGTSLMGDVAGVLAELPSFAVEFAATGGVYSGAKVAAEKTIRGALRKALGGKVASVARKVVGAAAGAGAQAAVSAPLRVAENTLERMTPGVRISRDEAGALKAVVEDSGDGFAEAFVKSVGNAYVETLSERTGVVLEKAVAPLKAAVVSRWFRLNPENTTAKLLGKLQGAARAAGWNGILGEMFEERVGEVLRTPIEGYKRPTPEQLAAEAIAFAIPGAPGSLMRVIGGRRKPQPSPSTDPTAFRAMGQVMQELKMAEASPEALTQVAKQIAGTDTFLIPAESFVSYFQEQKDEEGQPVDPREIAREIWGDTKEYDEAVVDGTAKRDLVIPAARYLQTIARTDHNKFFAKVMRRDPLEVNADEAKVLSDRATKKAEAVKAKEAAPQEKPPNLTSRVKDTVSKVGERVKGVFSLLGLGKLEGMKGFGEGEAGQFAKIVEASYRERAKLLGVDPLALFEEEAVELGIAGDIPAGSEVLTQPAEATPEPGKPAEGKITRGFTEIQERKIRVAFTKAANYSTPLHELGHVWLEVLGRDVEALGKRDAATLTNVQREFLKRAEVLREWLGVGSLRKLTKAQHEKFAEEVEKYFATGKAPSVALKRAFRQFKKWLLEIYASLRGKVEVAPAVQDIMDRLLATEEEVVVARAEQGAERFFSDPEAAWMSPKQAAKIAEVLDDVERTAGERLGAKMLEARTREREAWYQEALAEERKTVESEVNRRREYVAESILKYGTLPDGKPVPEALGGLKLSADAVREQFGAVVAKAVSADYLTGEGGAAPDYAAEILGFTSGDELVKVLSNLENKESLIDRLTTERMAEQYGDLLTDPGLPEEAIKAVHTEEAAKLLQLEAEILASEEFATFKQLQRRIQGKPKRVEEYAREAHDEIFAKAPNAIKPNLYRRAEQKAAQEAIDAFEAGMWQTAFDAKVRQLEAHERYRASLEALERADKVKAFVRPFSKLLKRQALAKAGPSYLEQIDGIMDRFSFRVLPQKKTEKLATLREWYEAQKADGIEPEIPEKLLDEAYKRNWRDVSVAELEEIEKTVKQIDHLATTKNSLLASRDKREFEAAVKDLNASIEANSKGKRGRSLTEDNAVAKYAKSYLALHRRFSSFARQFDGWKDGGVAWELLVRPQNEAASNEAEALQVAAEKLRDLFAVYGSADRPKMKRHRTHIPELGSSMTKEQLLMLALNWGNLDSRQKVVDGLGVYLRRTVTEDTVKSVLDRELDEWDWKFVQSVFDYLDTFWPQAKALSERVNGIAPEKVEAEEIETKFGKLRGGYFPLRYDPARSDRTRNEEAAEEAKRMMRGSAVRSTTKHAHREARVKGVERVVRLDFGVIFQHVGEVIRDLSYYEYLIDANRLLRDSRVADQIRDHYGAEALTEMREMLQDIAGGDNKAQNAIDAALAYLRRGTSTAMLGFKVSTALVQPLGITQSIVRVGPKWVAKGLARWVGSAAHMESTVKTIHEKSKFMAQRHRTQIREINEVRNQLRPTGKFRTKYQQYALWMTTKAQMLADIPTWLGAYEKANAEAPVATSEAHVAELEERAIALADQAVLDSQGGGQVKDLARVQRVWWLKPLTMFSNYMIARHNLARESFGRTEFTDPVSLLKLAGDLILLYPAPVALGFLIKHAIRGGDDRDIEEKLLKDVAFDPFGGFMVARDITDAAKFGAAYRGPAGFAFATEFGDFFAQAAQAVDEGETDEAFWRSLNDTAGIYFHYPAKQLDATIRGLFGIAEDGAGIGSALLGPPPK